MIQVTRRSQITGKLHTRNVNVMQEEIDKWEAGALIQDAMPNVSADDREFLMTGITPEEWEEIFGKKD